MIRQFGFDYISAQDAAQRYGYTIEHIQTLARLNKVCHLKMQKVVFVRLVDIHEYAAKHLAARIAQKRGTVKK